MVEIGPSSARRLLGVFAHPDDEVFCAAGTMAWAAEAGAEVMIVSATRGEQGQIRDPTAATRRTLGAVREGELSAAAAELGVQRVQVLAYPDGGLQHHRSSLGPAIAEIMRQFDPDTVITFGADGGYGHPDHVAISELTSEAFRALARDHNRAQRLYHAVFPPRSTSMAEELAHWIAGSGQRATDRAALQAIALFAGEAATMRLARDDVARHRTQYPVVPTMLPRRLLQSMLGTEFFRSAADGNPAAAIRCTKAPPPRRPLPRSSARRVRIVKSRQVVAALSS